MQNVKSIDKVTLKNLPELRECTIGECSMQDLVIEGCPQLKVLNVKTNFLTNLEFLANLENLEELELSGNAKLTEILKSYKGDGKACQKDIQEIFELTKQNNFQGLVKKYLDLKMSREDLKKDFSSLLPEEKQQKSTSGGIETKELVLSVKKELEDKETEINRLEEEKVRLEKMLKLKKLKEELESLKSSEKKELESKLEVQAVVLQGGNK